MSRNESRRPLYRRYPGEVLSAVHEGAEGTEDPEADSMSSLPEDQHMARVTISDEQWLEFRALSIRKKRSVAAYLGHLVQNEIGRDARAERRRAARQVARKPEYETEVDESWVPPWEE